MVVNQPSGYPAGYGLGGASVLGPGLSRNPNDAAGSNRRGAGAAATGPAAAMAAAAAAAAAAALPPMANEGRWTDNGQPLTGAESRTVMPMLEQVEQAVTARLIPSQPPDVGDGGDERGGRGGGSSDEVSRSGAGAGADAGASGGAGAEGTTRENEEVKEEQVRAHVATGMGLGMKRVIIRPSVSFARHNA